MSDRISWAIAILLLAGVLAFWMHIRTQAHECESRGGIYARKWSGGYACLEERRP